MGVRLPARCKSRPNREVANGTANLYEFFRNEDLNARNYFDQTTSLRHSIAGTISEVRSGRTAVDSSASTTQNKQKTFVFFSEEAPH